MENNACPKCKEMIPAGKFCPHCGAALTKRCAKCGADMSVSDRYCQHCGQDNSPEAVARLCDERREKRNKYLALPRKLSAGLKKLGAKLRGYDSRDLILRVLCIFAVVYAIVFVLCLSLGMGSF